MHQTRPRSAQTEEQPADDGNLARRLVVGLGVLLVAAHVAYRGWVVYGGFFFADDYTLLIQARATDLDTAYLGEVYAGHLIPGGRLIAWVVGTNGTLNWPLAATITLGIELLTCLAALWMFFTVFGARWGSLAPLAIYLTTSLTLPAFVWWGATLLQLPTQLAFFVGVGAWVRYLRGHRIRWALAAYLGVAIGVVFDVKALVVLPVLAYLALAYFADGWPVRRVVQVLRRYWAAAAIGLPVVGAYAVYFLITIDQPYDPPGWSLTGTVLQTLLGETLPTTVLGGPWQWEHGSTQPNSLTDPPGWSVSLAWVGLAGLVAYGVLRRTRTLRAWGLVGLGVVLDVVLLLATRASAFGPPVARELRYYTDLAPVVVLALGLAFLELPGARQCSREREQPLLALRVGRRTLAGVVGVVCVLGLVSQSLYARQWHVGNKSEPYLETLRAELASRGAVDLVDQPVPEDVVQSLVAPYNTLSRLVTLLPNEASFPHVSPSLLVVAADGSLHRGQIQPGLFSRPGPREDCGWLVRSAGRDVPLEGLAFDSQWWLRIGYLSGGLSGITVSAGGTEVRSSVHEGLGELWVRVDGTFDSVRLDGLDEGASMCVDKIEVGQPVPGGFL